MSPFDSILNFRARKPVGQPYPGLPKGELIYVIGDIHGRLDKLVEVHRLIDADREGKGSGARATEIYLGDYVDRGADSRGVIDCLLARAGVTDTVFLRGNHEEFFEKFLKGEFAFESWRGFGGAETLASYGLEGGRMAPTGQVALDEIRSLVPADHLRFLGGLKTYHVVGRYCFVHAGLRPNVPLSRQSVADLTGIRNDFLNHRGDFGCVVVHGHTPVSEVDFRTNRINIDTGAYITNRLSVLRIDAAGPTVLPGDKGSAKPR